MTPICGNCNQQIEITEQEIRCPKCNWKFPLEDETMRSYYDVEKEEIRQERELEWQWLTLRETLGEENENAVQRILNSNKSYADRLQDYHDWLCDQAAEVGELIEQWK